MTIKHTQAIESQSSKKSLQRANSLNDSPHSATFFHALFDSMSQAIICSDIEGIIIYCNKSVERLLGFPVSEMMGNSVETILSAEEQQIIKGLFKKVSYEKASYYNHSHRITKSGRKIWVSSALSGIKGPDDSVIGIVCTMQELSEQEADLQTKQHQASILNSTEHAIITTNYLGIITSWNQAAERIYGYGSSESIGANILSIIPKEQHQEIVYILSHYFPNTKPYHLEGRRQRKDGSQFFELSTVTQLKDLVGKYTGFCFISIDATKWMKEDHSFSNTDILPLSNNQSTQKQFSQLIRQKWRDGSLAPLQNTNESSKHYTSPITYHTEPKNKVRLLAAIVESSENAIISTDLHGYITSWNFAAERVFGYSATEALGQFLETMLPDISYHEVVIQLQRIKKPKAIFRYRSKRIHKDGSEIWVTAVCSPILLANTKLVGISTILTPLTPVQMQERENWFLQAILDSSEHLIIVINLAGMIGGWNKGAEQVLGYSADEVIGKLASCLLPEDKQASFLWEIQQVILNGSKRLKEECIVKKDGNYVFITGILLPITDPTNAVIGLSLIAIDATQWKQQAETSWLLRSIVEHSESAIAGIDLNGKITIWNRAAEKLFGYTANEIIGTHADKLFPEDQRKNHLNLRQKIKQGFLIDYCPSRRVHKDGHEFWVSSRISPIKDINNNVIGLSAILNDISERYKQEDALSHLAAVIDSSEGGIVCTDLNGTIKIWNKGAEYIYSHTSEEMIGKNVSFLFSDEISPSLGYCYHELIKGKPVVQLYTKKAFKDGKERFISNALTAIKNNLGQVTGVSILITDMAQHFLQEEALWLLAAIVESSENAIISTDLEGYVKSWNQGAEKLFGYSVQEIIGKSISCLCPPDCVNDQSESIQEVMSNKAVKLYETIRLKKDGSRVYVSVSMSPVKNKHGEIIGISNIKTDITDRKKQEDSIAHLAAIVESLDDAISSLDLNGIITSWNKGAEKIYGFSAQEALGKRYIDLIHSDHLEFNLRELARLKSQGTLPHMDAKYTTKEGQIIDLDLAASSIKNADGETTGYSFIVRDITRRKQLEKELILKSSRLEQSNNDLDDFTYIIAHDLREPLRGIYNYTEFLLQDYQHLLDTQGIDMLNTVLRLSEKLTLLLDSLLNYSKIDRIEFCMEYVNLDTVVRSVLDSLQVTLKEKNIEIRYPRPLPTVYCDKIRIGEVFLNLILNATKYSNKAQKWVEIGYENYLGPHLKLEDATNQPQFVFYIADNGIGISEKHLETIFKMFSRLHKDGQFGAGAGVGLTIVKKIIKRHQGKVWVTSRLDEGSKFHFTLAPTRSEKKLLQSYRSRI